MINYLYQKNKEIKKDREKRVIKREKKREGIKKVKKRYLQSKEDVVD